MKTKDTESRVFSSGKGKFTVDSGVYPAVVKSIVSYETGDGEQVKGIIELELTLPDGATRAYKQNVLLMSKDGNYTYKDDNSGADVLYGDVSIISDIANIACKKLLENLETQDTMIEIYDFTTKSNKPVPASSLVELIGAEVSVAILEYETFKNKQVGGDWVETEETRLNNQIEIVMQAGSNKTLKELRAQVEEPVAHNTWLEYWAGKVKEAVSKNKGKKGKNTKKASKNDVNIPEVEQDDSFGF